MPRTTEKISFRVHEETKRVLKILFPYRGELTIFLKKCIDEEIKRHIQKLKEESSRDSL